MSPPAVELIAGNEDLLTQVLSNLPVRPLLRFKSVSKQWLRLISDRRFSRLHSALHRNPSSSALVFLRHSPISSPPSLQFIPLCAANSNPPPPFFSRLASSDFKILQSCNGLFLLGSLLPKLDDNLDFAYFVCNPTANQISRLPAPDVGNLIVAGVNLAFDPGKRDGYKIICISKSNSDANPNQYGIHTYLRETGQWRRAIDCATLPFDLEPQRGVYCDGKIHWLSHTESSAFFDSEAETIGLLPLPPPPIEDAYIERFRYFGESKGHLHLVEMPTNSVSEFNVLELHKETSVWCVKYRVNLDAVGSRFHDMFQNYNDRFGRGLRFYAFSILAVVRAEQEEDAALLLSVPGKVISYKFATGLADLRCEVGDDTDKWLPLKGYNAFQFIESLYCI